jgi:hypothetical protein
MMGDGEEGIKKQQLEAWLSSGSERPVVLATRAQRVAGAAAFLFFLAWLFWARTQADWIDNLVFSITMLAVIVAIVLRVVVRKLDLAAMRKDAALLERMKEEEATPPREPRP